MTNPRLKQFMHELNFDNIIIPETVNQNTQPPQAPPGNPNFSLEDLTQFWRINGVNYRNGIYQVDLGKEMLENKAQKTQDGWIEYTKKALTNDGFYVGDAQLYHALFKTLFKNKDNAQYKDKIEQAKAFLQNMLKDYWLMTLSRIKYAKSGQDAVIHNHGLQDKFEIQDDIIGADGYVTQINPQTALQAVLGDNNVNEINQVYNWITGKNLYLWRLNAKPQEDTERIVRFDSYSGWAYLNCYWFLNNSNRGLPVRAKKF